MRQICVECFKALSVNTRFRIFHYLEKANKGVNISELVKIIGLKQPTVTFHVNKLAKVNLIKKKKSGRVTFCSISPRCNNCLLIKN